MLKNRSLIKRLLRIVLSKIHTLEDFGLCWFLFYLQNNGSLTRDERHLVEGYLDDNLIDKAKGNGYVWPPGSIEPRKKWLIEQIEKL